MIVLTIKGVLSIMNNVCYNNLFKLLIDKGLKKSEFSRLCNISAPTLSKLSKNEYVSMDVLVRICRGLDCTLDDIVEIIKKDN